MPLSKARDRERKRQSRLDKCIVRPAIQPKAEIAEDLGAFKIEPSFERDAIAFIDADGNPVYDD